MILPAIMGATARRTWALQFSGTPDYVDIANPAELSYRGDTTICAWVNIASRSSFMGIFGDRSVHNEANFILYQRNQENRDFGSVFHRNGRRYLIQFGNYIADTWMHVAVTINNSLDRVGYIDGDVVSPGLLQDESKSNEFNNVSIGRTDSLSPGYFVGKLRDIRIFSRTLSAVEINDVYKGKTITNDLLGWWRLDEGKGSVANDSSGNDNHGTITGAEWVKG